MERDKKEERELYLRCANWKKDYFLLGTPRGRLRGERRKEESDEQGKAAVSDADREWDDWGGGYKCQIWPCLHEAEKPQNKQGSLHHISGLT